jgi:hypothetical protein
MCNKHHESFIKEKQKTKYILDMSKYFDTKVNNNTMVK